VVFFAFVIDVYSRRVVGWQLAGDMRTDLVLDALRMALSRRRAGADVELIHHSDAGNPVSVRPSPAHGSVTLALYRDGQKLLQAVDRPG
jgi:transposase InsO family protein